MSRLLSYCILIFFICLRMHPFAVGDESKKPQRIVSLTLMGDEILTGLNSFEQVSALTLFSNQHQYTQIAPNIPQSIKHIPGNLEAILKAKSDLVLISEMNATLLTQRIETIGIPIFKLSMPDTFKESFSQIMKLGKRIGKIKEAKAWIEKAQNKLQSIRDFVQNSCLAEKSPSVLYIEKGRFIATKKTFINHLIKVAGGHLAVPKALAQAQTYTQIPLETLLAIQPDVIITPSYQKPHTLKNMNDPFIPSFIWNMLPAVKKEQTISIPAAWIHTGTPYNIKGANILAKRFHQLICDQH